MGWTCLQTQSETFDRIRAWEKTQGGYAKDNGDYLFFDFSHKGKDYGTKETPNMELEVFEVTDGKAYRRGTLEIRPDGWILNRSYVCLPEALRNPLA